MAPPGSSRRCTKGLATAGAVPCSCAWGSPFTRLLISLAPWQIFPSSSSGSGSGYGHYSLNICSYKSMCYFIVQELCCRLCPGGLSFWDFLQPSFAHTSKYLASKKVLCNWVTSKSKSFAIGQKPFACGLHVRKTHYKWFASRLQVVHKPFTSCLLQGKKAYANT